MEGSESEAIFDTLNLNPQLFVNSALNSVDELIDGAFDHLLQESLTQLKIDGTDRAEDLSKGLNYIRNNVQSSLDKRLAVWEKYCFDHCFMVPEGFSLPKANEAGDDFMDVDAVDNPDLDAELDSLRKKLTMAEQESAELRREIQALERQSVISNCHAASINEALELYEKISTDDLFKELQKSLTEYRLKVEKLKAATVDGIQRTRMERLHLRNGDLLRMISGNGFSSATTEDIEGFLSGLKTR